MRYESDADLRLRLQGSVILYGERPVVVLDVGRASSLHVQDILDGEEKRVNIKNLDLNPVKLGYIIINDTVAYAARKPARRFKQGLTNENLVVRPVLTDDLRRPMHVRHTDISIGKAIMGHYPSIEGAFKEVRSGAVKARPFSREWAVGRDKDDLCILYRGEIAGFVTDDSVKLMPELYYLKESLTAALQ